MSIRTAAVCLLVIAITCVAAGAEPTKAKSAKPATTVAQMSGNLRPTRTIVYKTVGDRKLEMHIFEPEGFKATDTRPCFTTIHGGGWVGGSPQKFYAFANHFAKLGFVGVSLQYRLVDKQHTVTVYDCVKDGRSAVRYLRGHAAELGINPQKIVVSGGSAGGHVAASTALCDGIDEAGDDLSVSCVPNALVLLFPVIDTSKDGYGNRACGPRWQELSPLHHVKAGLPPTIVFHGTADTTTPYKGAQAFHEAMAEAGNRCELVTNEGGKHGYLMSNLELYDEAMQKAEAFLGSLGIATPRP